jgi:hypothetical protein
MYSKKEKKPGKKTKNPKVARLTSMPDYFSPGIEGTARQSATTPCLRYTGIQG